MNENEPIDLLIQLIKKLNEIGYIKILAGLLVLVILVTGIFKIEPEEVGLILRFGKYIKTVEPGLNFKIPLGVEKVIKVPIQRQLKQEFGFSTLRAGVQTRYSTINFDDVTLMLTGDLNIADVEWSVQYRIKDPYKYNFKVRNTRDTFRDINEAVMREVIGDKSVNYIFTKGKTDIAVASALKIQQLCDQYETGIRVIQVVLKNVNPPEAVKASYNEVNEAEQEGDKLVNEAKSEFNKVVPKAKGEAEKLIKEAEGYAIERVNIAKGEASRFKAIYKEYIKAPEVTRTRIYLETMNDVMQNAGKKLISDRDMGGILPLFQLDSSSKMEA